MKTPAPFTGNDLGLYRHICAFFNSVDEQHRVIGPYIVAGFAEGDRAFHSVAPEQRGEHLSWLASTGVGVAEAMSTGQLEVHSWDETHTSGGSFDMDSWMVTSEEMLRSSGTGEYGPTRFFAHMEWALLGLPGTEHLMEYESRLNYLIPKYPGTVVCAYDTAKFGASAVVDALRTHPAVIIGGLLQENPFYAPPDQLLSETREQGPGRRGPGAAN